MEQFIRKNFNIVDRENDDGTVEDAFEYVAPNGNLRKTKLKTFLNKTEMFYEIIDYWKSQGMEVPQ